MKEKMTTLSMQRAHLKSDSQRRLNQADLIGMSEEKLKFLMKSNYDRLPTLANNNNLFDMKPEHSVGRIDTQSDISRMQGCTERRGIQVEA